MLPPIAPANARPRSSASSNFKLHPCWPALLINDRLAIAQPHITQCRLVILLVMMPMLLWCCGVMILLVIHSMVRDTETSDSIAADSWGFFWCLSFFNLCWLSVGCLSDGSLICIRHGIICFIIASLLSAPICHWLQQRSGHGREAGANMMRWTSGSVFKVGDWCNIVSTAWGSSGWHRILTLWSWPGLSSGCPGIQNLSSGWPELQNLSTGHPED